MSGINEHTAGTSESDATKQVILSTLDSLGDLQASVHPEEIKILEQSHQMSDHKVDLPMVNYNNLDDLPNSSDKTTAANSTANNSENTKAEHNYENIINTAEQIIMKPLETQQINKYEDDDVPILSQKIDEQIQKLPEAIVTQGCTVEQLLSAMKSLPEQFLGPLTAALQGLSTKVELEPQNEEKQSKANSPIPASNEVINPQPEKSNYIDENLLSITGEINLNQGEFKIEETEIPELSKDPEELVSSEVVCNKFEPVKQSEIIFEEEIIATPTVAPQSRMNALKSLKSRFTSMISRLPLSKATISSIKMGGLTEKIEQTQINSIECTQSLNIESLNPLPLKTNCIADASSEFNYDKDKNISFVSDSACNHSETYKSSAIIIPVTIKASAGIDEVDNLTTINKDLFNDQTANLVVDRKENATTVCFQKPNQENSNIKCSSSIFIEPLRYSTKHEKINDIAGNKLDDNISKIEDILVDGISGNKLDSEVNKIYNNAGDELILADNPTADGLEEIKKENLFDAPVNPQAINNLETTTHELEDILTTAGPSLPEKFELKITESPSVPVNDAAPLEEPPVVRGSLRINLSRISNTKEQIIEPLKLASQQSLDNEPLEPAKPLTVPLPKLVDVESKIETSIEIKKSGVRPQFRNVLQRPISKARPKSPVKRPFLLRRLPTRKCFNAPKKVFGIVPGSPKDSTLSRAKEFADRVAGKSTTVINSRQKNSRVAGRGPEQVSKLNVKKELKIMSDMQNKIPKKEATSQFSSRCRLPSKIPIYQKKPQAAGQTVSVSSQKIIKVNALQPGKSNINHPRRFIPVLQPLTTTCIDRQTKINDAQKKNSNETINSVTSPLTISPTSDPNPSKNIANHPESCDNVEQIMENDIETNRQQLMKPQLLSEYNEEELISSSESANDDSYSENDAEELEEDEEQMSEEEISEEEISESSESELTDSHTKSSVILKKLDSTDDLTSAELMLKKTLDGIKAEISDSEYSTSNGELNSSDAGNSTPDQSFFQIEEQTAQQSPNDKTKNQPIDPKSTQIEIEQTKVLRVRYSEPEIIVGNKAIPKKRFSIVASYVQQFEGDTPKYERQESFKRTREKSPKDEREVSLHLSSHDSYQITQENKSKASEINYVC